MQYSATSYNRELETVGSERGADVKVREFTEEELFPGPHTFRNAAKHSADRAARTVNRYFLKWLHRWTARLALFQTGKTNHYVLHGLLLLLLILVLTLFGVL